MSTEIASHRGGALIWPENSPTAFRNTVVLGTEQIEFDVQMTRDGVVVVFHDATLDRVTDGRGPLGDKTLDELRTLSINGSNGEQIMTLGEACDILEPSPILLRCELKAGVDMRRYDGLEQKTADILTARKLLGRTIFTSFQLPALKDIMTIAPDAHDFIWLVSRQVLGCLGEDAVCAAAERSGIKHMGLHQADIDAERVRRLDNRGLRLGGWAAHDEEAIRRMLEIGVSVFTSDRPDLALHLRDGTT